MKKSIFLVLVLLTATLVSWAYGDTETRSIKSFSEISVSAGIEATLEKGSANKIEIDAEGIDLDKVITKVDGDKLIVKIESSWWKMGWNSKRKVKVNITYTEELEEISSSSGASVYSNDVINSDRLRVQASSGARLELELDNNDLSADVSSGANMELSGSTKKLDVDVSSGSSFNSYDLVSDEAKLDASSGASIKVTVNKSIIASASSGASIKYNGSPDVTDIDKSSGGSVRSN